MRCRQIVSYTDLQGKQRKQVVWFNKVINAASNAVICSDNTICSDNIAISNDDYGSIKAKNYVDNQAAVASSLTQRLSVIRGELWYAIKVGLPLMDKTATKAVMDAYVASVISGHPDVVSIQSFKSTFQNRVYSCTFTAFTIFGELVISI